MSYTSAHDVLTRFIDEQTHINTYTQELRSQYRISDRFIERINEDLKANELIQLPERKSHKRRNDHFTQPEVELLLNSFERTEAAIDDVLSKLEDKYPGARDHSTPNIPREFEGFFNELTDYLSELIPLDDPPFDDRAKFVQYVYDAKARANPTLTDEFDIQADKDIDIALIEGAIIFVLVDRAFGTYWELMGIKEKFRNIRFAARLLAPTAEINVLRQGFILLMTAFDAAVFDIARVALRDNFFSLISRLGKQEKLSLKQFESCTSFDGFRDHLIESQLKSLYVKDLLLNLQSAGAECASNRTECAQIIELILRRNVHVHNRGIVDDRFLEIDDTGKSKYNFYGLKLGDSAVIDAAYFKLANELCTKCIRKLAEWATNLK